MGEFFNVSASNLFSSSNEKKKICFQTNEDDEVLLLATLVLSDLVLACKTRH